MQRVFLILCLLSSTLFGQQAQSFIKRIVAIDSLKNDSVALALLEKMQDGQLTTMQKMHLNLRIVKYAGRMQQFQKAITLGRTSLATVQGMGSDSLEAAYNLQLGATYYYMDQRLIGLEFFKKAAPLAKKSGAWMVENKSYNNIGGVLTDYKRYKEAEPYLLKAIDIMNAHGCGDEYGTLLSYRVLGELYKQLEQYGRAKTIYSQLLEKPYTKKDSSFQSDVWLYYSALLLKEGKLDSALLVSEKALDLARSKKMFHELVNLLVLRSRILTAAGRHEEAYKIMADAFSVQKKSFTQDLGKKISEVEVKYKTAEILKEKELAEENTRKQKWIYLLSFAGILILMCAVAYILNQRKTNRQKAASNKLRLEALIEGEEKERSRIARDLHDGIVQDLTAIKLKLVMAKDNEAKLNSAMSDIDRTTKEVRDIAYQMMPVALREFGLVAALDQLLEKSLTPNNITYDFETVNIEERLPEKIEICLYRLTQELINNVLKHSRASTVSLVVSHYQDFVTLILEDNGNGFKEGEVNKGIGMNSLSSRLEMVNGNLKFESAKGAGTIAIIKIPLA